MNIILIGFKSAGKTTIGKKLAEKMEKDFIDVDSKIAEIYLQKYGEQITARQIYLKLGDLGYRVLEKKAIIALAAVKNAVIATGGGSVCDPGNVEALGRSGKFVYLDVPKEIVQKRITEDSDLNFLDPKHPAKNFEQSFVSRQKIYREIADFVINTENKTVKEAVKIIEESFYGK